MRKLVNSVLIAFATSLLMLLPVGDPGPGTPVALAASGASYAVPPNYNFESGPLEVGPGPANYDFADGGSGWSKTGNVTYSGGVATLTGNATLTSSNYTLTSNVQALKIRYKVGTSNAQVALYIGGVVYGSDNLSCIGCVAGEWVEKYIGIYTSARGQTAKVRLLQTSGTSEVDWVGTQWITFQEWMTTSVGTKSQARQDSEQSQFLELRNPIFSKDFVLTDNRFEFDYAFPLAGETTISIELRRASDGLFLTSTPISGNGPSSWAPAVWNLSQGYVGEEVYLRLSDAGTQPSWIDNLGINLAEAISRDDHPSSDAGDPFDTASGQVSHSHTDIAIPGQGAPLEFTRFYQSMVSTYGNLGHNWRHTYSTSLRIDSDNSVTVYYASGGAAYFKYESGSYSPPAGVHDGLVKNGDGTYTLTTITSIRYNFTPAGSLASIVDRNDNATTISYDGNGFLRQVQDTGGRSLIFTPDANGRIAEIEDPLGRTVGFGYDGNGDLVDVTDVKAGTTNYTYSNHRMTSLTDSNGHLQNENIYDGANRVVEQTDAMGGETCVYYGSSPSYISDDCPGVSPTPSAGQTVVVDPRGYETTYDFDTKFRTTSVTDHDGGVTSFTFDSSNNPTCVTDPRGKKTAYSYDPKGNVTQMIDAENTDANYSDCRLEPGGVKWDFEYTANNDIDLETDPLGRQTDYVYDSSGNLTQVIRKAAGGSVKALTCFEYNDPGNPGLATASVQSTDLNPPQDPAAPCTGNTTDFEYDQYGNQTAVVNPRFSGQPTPPKTTFTYDLGGRMLTATNEMDETTTYTYDPQNNVLSVLDGLGNVTSSAYDAKGNLKTVTDANRKAVGTAESGSQCGAAGTGNDTDDDGDGVKDDGCPSAIYNYDNGDRLIEVVDALGNSTTYGYDANGNRTSVTNAKRQAVGTNGPETGSQCGTAGTGNGVNEDEALDDTVADDGCPSTIYAYDALNRLTSATDALGYVTSYQYDATSNLTQRTDARGLITRYFPDDLNRVDILQHCTADAPPGECSGEYLVDSVDYTYNAAGFRTQMADPTGTTTYTPDDLDRIAGVTFPGPKTVSYTYDDLPGGSAADYPGQRTRITYPDAKEVEYTYEADGRMKTVTDWLAKQTVYTYDDAGRLTKTELPNGTWSDYGYDAADRLTSVANKKTGPETISSFGYELDAAGNRKQMTDLSGVHSYQYDPLYRLKQVTYPGPATDTYTYDANGNREAKNGASYTYDDADRMLTAAGVTYGYDENGNQTGRGADTFEYDHENRLTKVNPSGSQNRDPCFDFNGDGQSHIEDTTAVSARFGAVEGDPNYDPYYDIRPAGGDGIIHMEDLSAVSAQFGAVCLSRFVYDGDGLRVRRDGNWGQTWDYTWDVAAGLPVILNEKDRHYQLDGETAGHGVNNTYVYGLDLISVTDKQGNQSYFQYDGLGSTTDLTDGSANVTASYGYDVFGALRSGSPGANSFLFTGEQRDAGLGSPAMGLYYLRARYYDTGIGRFLGRDPVSGGNLYAYVGNNPVNLVDPYGLFGFKDIKKGLSKAIRSVANCATDYGCSQQWSHQFDWWAAQLQTAAAVTTNVFTVGGCIAGAAVSAGVMTGPGCLLGKGIGEWFTQPLQQLSNVASIGSTVLDCVGRFADEKEGGGFTWKNAAKCGTSAAVTVVGFIPEANLNAALANYQLYCRDEGRCSKWLSW